MKVATKVIEKNCNHCGKLHTTTQREITRGFGKYCSLRCAGAANSVLRKQLYTKLHAPNVQCAQCKKAFYKRTSRQKGSKSGLFFCCRACKDTAQRIGGIKEITPPHYGATVGLYNYRNRALLTLQNKCDICGYNRIPQILQVHHKSGDRSDNSLNNLQILCPTCHQEVHFLTKTGAYRVRKPSVLGSNPSAGSILNAATN